MNSIFTPEARPECTLYDLARTLDAAAVYADALDVVEPGDSLHELISNRLLSLRVHAARLHRSFH